MVRLCVPAGEDQHALTRQSHKSLSAAEPSLIESPFRACLLATGLTALSSILGTARPGAFLRNVSIIGLIDGAVTACDIYGRQELDRAVFKMDGLNNPKPFKLWERSKHWTLEDASLLGGATGLLAASNRHLFPGISGVSRFLGATITGFTIGAKTAEWAWASGVSVETQRIERATQRQTRYKVLAADKKAKASLSRYGRALLMSYTGDNTLMRMLSMAPKEPSTKAGSRVSAADGHTPAQNSRMAAVPQQVKKAQTPSLIAFSVMFREWELAAPDYVRGYRDFSMDPKETDLDTMQQHLEQLNKLRESEGRELVYIWQTLPTKEHRLHQLPQEDPEKDVLRCELQILNLIATNTQMRLAVINYARADARRRIAQIKNEDRATIVKQPLLSTDESLLEEIHYESHVPSKTTGILRQYWNNKRRQAAEAEALLARYEESRAKTIVNDPNSPQDKSIRDSIQRINENLAQGRRNVKAAERLLKEFEDQSAKAENQISK